MNDSRRQGIFITFEGPDGAGKTTQIRKLADTLEQQGHRTMLTREPGGTNIGDQIRAILLSPDNKELDDRTEVLLYAASRAQHTQQKIVPALKEGYIVLCDRYTDASIAYQAYGLQLDESFVREASQFATKGLTPHRTYMFDLPVEESIRRLTDRAKQTATTPDRIEIRNEYYHHRVRQGFIQIAEANPERILLLDATLPVDELAAVITADCHNLIGVTDSGTRPL